MAFVKATAAACIAAAALAAAAPAQAQDCFLGEIKMFAGNFAPRGYALAQGQQMPIAQYSALFAILGTTYGGDGQTYFNLPDLRGRVAIGAGQGPGLDAMNLGVKSGDAWTAPRQGNAAKGTGSTVGTPAPISNMQPSLGVNYLICLEGYFPSHQ